MTDAVVGGPERGDTRNRVGSLQVFLSEGVARGLFSLEGDTEGLLMRGESGAKLRYGQSTLYVHAPTYRDLADKFARITALLYACRTAADPNVRDGADALLSLACPETHVLEERAGWYLQFSGCVKDDSKDELTTVSEFAERYGEWELGDFRESWTPSASFGTWSGPNSQFTRLLAEARSARS